MIRLPKWEKQGLIYSRVDGNYFKSHAMRVIPYLKKNGMLRLFISSRCCEDMMHPTYIDVDPNNPKNVVEVGEVPLLNIGSAGLFDDSGITLGSILRTESFEYVYYTGWKRRRYGVSFELSIGVARILNDGDRLEKISIGPILAQDRNHPFLVAGPYVVGNYNHGFRMWYCSGTEWKKRGHGPEPIYTVFHTFSDDGISWKDFSEDPLIPYEFDGEVISAPWVLRLRDGYLMYYPHRGSLDWKDKNYSIGVAVSNDSINWIRKDSEAGIEKSETGWDSEMICYPAIFNYGDKTYMFYSGNGVGKGGIGYAIADEKLDIVEWEVTE
jgi:hypothetical protein